MGGVDQRRDARAADRLIATPRRPQIPRRGRGGLPVLGEYRGVIELAAKISGLGRALIPQGRSNTVGVASPTFLQTAAQQVHRPPVTLKSRASIPVQRELAVTSHAAAVEQHVAEIVFAPVVPALRR